MVKGAGHHIYADKAEEFNTSVNKICRGVDQEQEQGFRSVQSPTESCFVRNSLTLEHIL